MRTSTFNRRASWVDELRADLRYAWRHFAHTKLTAMTIVLVLGLGIGANAAIFSFLQALTTRPFPGMVRDPALVRIERGAFRLEDGTRPELTYSEVRALASRADVFQAVAAFAGADFVLDRAGDEITSVPGQFVTANFFRALGLRLAAGSGWNSAADDHTTDGVPVVISYALWQSRFGGDPSLIGGTVRLNGTSAHIVGVAPEHFQGIVSIGFRPSVWIPLSARAIVRPGSESRLVESHQEFGVAARLAPGATIERAQAAAATILHQMAVTGERAREPVPESLVAHVQSLIGLQGYSNRIAARTIAPLVAIGLLILAVVCANVSALALGGAVGRRQEIAVRLAVGASRARVVRLLVTESTLLAVFGGATGLFILWVITHLAADQAIAMELAPDAWTLTFTLLAAVGTGVLVGLSPALHATRAGVASVLKDSGGSAPARTRLQQSLIALQIAFTQPLLFVAATILVITLGRVPAALNGAADAQVVGLRFNALGSAGGELEDSEVGARLQRVNALVDEITRLPNVVRVTPDPGPVRSYVVYPTDPSQSLAARTTAGNRVQLGISSVTPEYLTMIQARLVRGRRFEPSDSAAPAHPIILGVNAARALFGAQDPLGKRVLCEGCSGSVRRASDLVVGLFDDSRATNENGGVQAYRMSLSRASTDVLVEVARNGTTMIPTLQAFARQRLPDIRLYEARTLEQRARDDWRATLQTMAATAGGGLLVLVLASIGLYAVVALGVQQRTREVGIRIALGARPTDVTRLFLGQGLGVGARGLLYGLPVTAYAAWTGGTTFQILQAPNAGTAAIAIGIALMVLVVAGLASWLPARRAARVDVMRTVSE